MFVNMPLIADWQAIAHTHEHHVNENLRHTNRKQSQFDYALGQQVLKKVHNPTKLGARMEGPYTIECVHVNCNIRSAKQDDIYGASNIILPCPGS
jgi:hypothetical protein